MINPNKYIRKAFASVLSAYGLSVYDEKVPKSALPVPKKYILLTTQTKEQDSLAKDCKVWNCTINLDTYVIQELSYISTVEIDDFEELIQTAITNSSLDIEKFGLVSLKQLPTQPLNFDTDTNSILRRVIRYRLVLEEGEGLYRARLLENNKVRLLEN